jgi:hypothetical protein
MVRAEKHLNAGREDHIRIKGNQHLVALAFDTTRLKGEMIESARLICHRADAMIDGVTISTIQADWDEYRSNALSSGMRGVSGWGWPGAKFPAVTDGNSFSLVSQARTVIKGDEYQWDVDPDLIYANVIDAAYGLTLHEVSSDYSRNPTIWSRENPKKAPFLLVRLGGRAHGPQHPTELKILHSGDPDSLRLQLRAPDNGFAYEVMVNSKPLPRWNIPFVRAGEMQMIPIRDVSVKSGDKVEITVVTLNRIGERSSPASVVFAVPTPDSLPFPDIPEPTTAGPPPDGIAVIPLEDKYDVAGKPVGRLPKDYLVRNPVFDGKTIRLAAARGEVVGFQLLLKGNGRVTIECEVPGIRTEMYEALYVTSEDGLIPDPLVPLGELNLSRDRATSVCVDLLVPFGFSERRVRGTLTVSDGRSIPIDLRVRNFAIPKEASFLCEMNSYGLPDKVSEFYRLQEIAYDHRVHCNILHYSHQTAAPGARKSNTDMLMANGRRMDEGMYNHIPPGSKQTYWDDFISVFGPYLSGSHFENGHRGPVPAPGFYLTFHESWPLNVRRYFNGNPDAYEAFKASPVYAETFVNIMRDFINVAREQGWTRTGFQVYLNSKGRLDDPTRSPWTLDEPAEYWDYRALAYYGDLVREAGGENHPIVLDYRVDISRPEFARGQLRGKADLWVVSTSAFKEYPRLIADLAGRTGEKIWLYGTSNRVEETNRTIQAWVLDAYRSGAAGVIPWQTINRDGTAMEKADQLGLFIFARTPRREVAINHSMRLKAYRRAEQDVEYLELLRKKLELSPAQMGDFIDHYLDLGGTVTTRRSGDAGTPHYRPISPLAFHQLREAAATLLE